jgi:hypothetical protein
MPGRIPTKLPSQADETNHATKNPAELLQQGF